MRRRWFKTNLRLLAKRPLLFVRTYWWALLVMLVGMVLDAASTLRLARLYGHDVELHPAMGFMILIFGPVAGVTLGSLAKTCCVVFVAAIWRRWTPWLLLLCGVGYALAAVSNYLELL